MSETIDNGKLHSVSLSEHGMGHIHVAKLTPYCESCGVAFTVDDKLVAYQTVAFFSDNNVAFKPGTKYVHLHCVTNKEKN